MTDPAWREDHLIDLQQPQLRIGGIFIFEDAVGSRSVLEASAALIPDFASASSDEERALAAQPGLQTGGAW
jgi:hypothetical protein